MSIPYGIPKNLEVYEKDGQMFLRLDIKHEDSSGYYETHVEDILFDVNVRAINIVSDEWGLLSSNRNICTIDIGTGDELPVKARKDGTFPIETRIVKEKVHNLTVSEIEKKLGYKIHIVS